MLTTQWKFEPALIDRVFNDPCRFEFFQAVRILEAWLSRQDGSDVDVINNYIRFENSVSLNFPASEIESVKMRKGGRSDDLSLDLERYDEGSPPVLRITPTLFGLLGVSGTLPVHYTERIASHTASERNDGPRAFLDTFSSRAVALFFESWRKYKPEFNDRTLEPRSFLNQLLSIAGSAERCGDYASLESEIKSDTLAYFSAAIQHKPVSCVYVNQVLEDYFEVPIKVIPFIGAWYALPKEQQTALGGANAALGISALAGVRVWQRDLRQRIEIGPLNESTFGAFLPNGKSAQALKRILETFTGLSIEYEVKLILQSAAVRQTVLDSSALAVRLGQNAFLKIGHDKKDRSDLRYEILAF